MSNSASSSMIEIAGEQDKRERKERVDELIAKIDAIMKHETRMLYDEFKEYFMDGDDKYKDSQEEGEDGIITVKWGWDTDYQMPGYMCMLRWKVQGSKRQILRFNGSSIFAVWWSQYSDDVWSEDEEEEVSNSSSSATATPIVLPKISTAMKERMDEAIKQAMDVNTVCHRCHKTAEGTEWHDWHGERDRVAYCPPCWNWHKENGGTSHL